MSGAKFYVRRRGTARIVKVYLGLSLEQAKNLFASLYTPKLYYLSNDKGETL